MGFLDSFKEAMNRGKEAADNYIERERAKQQAAGTVTPSKTGAPAKTAAPEVNDPKAPFNFVVKDVDPITVKAADGSDVNFRLLANGRAMLIDPAQYEGQDYKAITRKIIEDTVRDYLTNPANFPDPKDVKAIMLLSSRLVPILTDTLGQKGIKAMFKLASVTPIQEG